MQSSGLLSAIFGDLSIVEGEDASFEDFPANARETTGARKTFDTIKSGWGRSSVG
jgi:hypothetical protein